jgi:hypothetical protein
MFGGGIFEFTCSRCRQVVGRGNSPLDGPASCPFCGARFSNGGLGRGGINPGWPDVNPGWPGVNPGWPDLNPDVPQAPFQPPVQVQPAELPKIYPPAPPSARRPSPAPWEARAQGPVLRAVVAVGLVLCLTGACLMIASARKSAAAGSRRRYA